ncbi:MAG TPA: UTP--glucose-1-phosphate uridylyltransferase GalU [Acidimicrobiales bacterium]|jgi:UTP--glucose-1-phosphate uridylyltransferase|nr:UTP--glucose-1-phosphate uridylyltransferase GalU [Acidimicrobiales bacterium]
MAPTARPAVRKAVIPAAGLGTRFLPATKASPKEMLPLVDKPAIQYVVEEAVRCGIRDILIITGRGKRSLEDHFDRSFELERHLESSGKTDVLREMIEIADMAEIHYVRQGEPLGLGHAVSVARDHIGDAPFAVLLGDDIMHERSGVLEAMLAAHAAYSTSVVALKQVPPADISSYGCAAVEPLSPIAPVSAIAPVPTGGDAENLVRITDIVEKPPADEAPSNLAVIGRYVLTPDIFESLEKVQPGAGGEIQLTDAIKDVLNTTDVLGWTFREGRYDVGNKLDYLRATVELALERDDLGPPLRAWLVDRLGLPGD